ncbi:MAG: hypothetical protein V4850_22995 [Myxococcota bacterium]
MWFFTMILQAAAASEESVCVAFGETSAPLSVSGTPSIQSSGVAASRSHPGRFFTHDDAGGDATLHVFERTASGAAYVGEQAVRGAVNTDWEDIATGPCPATIDAEWCLWIADIGDNDKLRTSLDIWVIPDTMDAGAATAHCPLVYEEGKVYDAEAIFVSPEGTLRIVTKEGDGEAKIYRIDEPTCAGGAPQVLWREAEIFPGEEITGATMNAAGTAVVLRSLSSAWLWTGCDLVWADAPTRVDLGVQPQGEAVTFALDGTLVSTSEGDPLQMWETVCVESAPLPCPTGCGCDAGAGALLVLVPLAWVRRGRRS